MYINSRIAAQGSRKYYALSVWRTHAYAYPVVDGNDIIMGLMPFCSLRVIHGVVDSKETASSYGLCLIVFIYLVIVDRALVQVE